MEKILRPQKTRNRLLSRRNGKVQPANVKKWRKNTVTWSLLPFTFHVKAVLNLSIIKNSLSQAQISLSAINRTFFLMGYLRLFSFLVVKTVTPRHTVRPSMCALHVLRLVAFYTKTFLSDDRREENFSSSLHPFWELKRNWMAFIIFRREPAKWNSLGRGTSVFWWRWQGNILVGQKVLKTAFKSISSHSPEILKIIENAEESVFDWMIIKLRQRTKSAFIVEFWKK